MLFRFRYNQSGCGHVHVRVFVGKGAEYTLASSGMLCFYPAEWEAFKASIETANSEGPLNCEFEFVEDDA